MVNAIPSPFAYEVDGGVTDGGRVATIPPLSLAERVAITVAESHTVITDVTWVTIGLPTS